MELRRFGEARDFLEAAGPFLVAREAEHYLILGVTSNLLEAPEDFSAPPYLATVSTGGRVVAARCRRRPSTWSCRRSTIPRRSPCLADDLADRDLPGALGPVEHVRAFVEARTARGGPPARLHISERIFRLTEVLSPTPLAPGRLRAAGSADRALVLDWIGAFHREALEPVTPSELAALTDRWLGGRGRTLYLWEDGEVVSLAGIGSPTPNGLRIGPVYTPPERRRHGYASALVAAMSQGGARRGPQVLLPVHGPGEPDLEPRLPVDRLRTGPRRRRVVVRAVTEPVPEPVMGESRLPMALAVLALMALAVVSPAGLALLPGWLLAAVEGILLVALMIGDPGRIDRDTRWLRLVSFALVAVILIST